MSGKYCGLTLNRVSWALEQGSLDWNHLYLATARPGKHYSGEVALHSSDNVIIRSESGVMVAHRAHISGLVEGGE